MLHCCSTAKCACASTVYYKYNARLPRDGLKLSSCERYFLQYKYKHTIICHPFFFIIVIVKFSFIYFIDRTAE
jgi:hypothetical protein